MSPVCRVGQGCDVEAMCAKDIISFVQQREAKGQEGLACVY